MNIKITVLSLFLICSFAFNAIGQAEYPFPVKYIALHIEQKNVKMVYMDVAAQGREKGAVVLFHAKNFNGYYWKDVAGFLSAKGYRVVIPDQVGWGKSDPADLHYSFHMLAANNKALLDSLHISKVIVIGHSMGGMLATRFALMYPDAVEKLVLENPIGLEDYRTFVPYNSIDSQYKTELSATFDSYKKYMQSYFPEWKPEYDELVRQQAAALNGPVFKQVAWANALTYDMIYEEPVCYEFKNVKAPTLLIIGQADRTIVGKDKVPAKLLATHGQYPDLGKITHAQIPGSKLVELPGVGHIPHIQVFEKFKAVVSEFLDK